MLQLKNSTPFSPQICLFPNESGIDTLYVMVKATFHLDGQLSVADDQVPPCVTDEYWGEPIASSVRYASEFHLSKPATDVAFVGSAWPDKDREATQLDVLLRVGDCSKPLRVFGDRQWQGSEKLSAPQPFVSMPIVYERAYGGVDESPGEGDLPPGESRNPVGVGFLGQKDPRALAGQPVANIEDPAQLIQRMGDSPAPAGFGFVASNWQPRLGYAGTYDEVWQAHRAPYLPDDFDPRFFNAAHPDLVSKGYLQGGEPVEAINLSPRGPLRFALPMCNFSLTVRLAGGIQEPRLNLETVLLEVDEQRLCMLWRAALPCDKQALKVEEVDVGLRDMKLA